MYLYRFLFLFVSIVSVGFALEKSANEKISEDAINALFEKAANAMERGLYEKAIPDFTQVIEKSRHTEGNLIPIYQCTSLANIGFCYHRLDQEEKALKKYEEVISKYKNTPDPSPTMLAALCLTYKNAGIIYMERKQYNLAEQCYKNVIDLSLNRKLIRYSAASAMQSLCSLYKKMGYEQKAIEISDAMLNEFKNDDDQRIFISLIESTIDKISIYIKEKKWNKAKESFYHFEKINKFYPSKEYEFSLMRLNSMMAAIAYQEDKWDNFFNLFDTYAEYRERVKSSDLDMWYTNLLYSAGIKLLATSDPKGAEKAYKTMEKIFSNTKDVGSRTLVYMSLYNLSILYNIEGNEIESTIYTKKAEKY